MTSKTYMNTYIGRKNQKNSEISLNKNSKCCFSYLHTYKPFDLIPQNGQTYTINLLGMFDNYMGSGL